jgi:hypothetical protein
MNEADLQGVYFFPLFYVVNPWAITLKDLHPVPLSIKVIVEPHERKKDKLKVTSADVFTVTNIMPPKPSTRESRVYLLDAITSAVETRTGMHIEPLQWNMVSWSQKR